MLLLGLQKLTLLDYPGKLACTVFTGGCDFRCPFCHNASLVEDFNTAQRLNEEDFFVFLEKRRGVLEGVCITGGEPTLQPDLKDFIIRIRKMGFLVKLDTNGNHPDVLKSLAESGLLDYVAMDIKNSPQKYGKTAGNKSLDLSKIKESVEFLLQNNLDYEFRTTVVKELHTPQDIESAAKWIKGAKRYFLQGFVDSGNLICEGYSGYDKTTMETLCKLAKAYVDSTEIRGF